MAHLMENEWEHLAATVDKVRKSWWRLAMYICENSGIGSLQCDCTNPEFEEETIYIMDAAKSSDYYRCIPSSCSCGPNGNKLDMNKLRTGIKTCFEVSFRDIAH